MRIFARQVLDAQGAGCAREAKTGCSEDLPLLYLGEINDSQERAWRKSIDVFDEGAAEPRTLWLFPEDRCEGLLSDTSIVRLRLSQARLCRPRQWGACWLALTLWRELQLDQFWARLPVSRKGTRWDAVLLVLTAYRLLAPGSEWCLHREWFERSALADLLLPPDSGRLARVLLIRSVLARCKHCDLHRCKRWCDEPS